jgi:murein hydrolase activator
MRARNFLFASLLVLCSGSSLFAQTRVQAPAGANLAERYQRAQRALEANRGNEQKTQAERDRLAAEASDLQQILIANAARVQELESQSAETAAELIRLNEEMHRLEGDLAHDRAHAAELLAVLQRLKADEPPALALRPDDSLAAMRGAMQMGAMLPPIYNETTNVVNRLKALTQTKSAVAAKEEQARREAVALNNARDGLNRVLQEKSAEQAGADAKLSELHAVVEEIGREAGDLKTLMDRIATLRAAGNSTQGMTVVGSRSSAPGTLARGALRPPVTGTSTPGDPAGPGRTPGANNPPSGLWFETFGKAEAVAPGDSEVVFAGNYQKLGQVLILELAGGYHLTLAGLGRIDVRIGDLVLAGEPVGVLPEGKTARLYMELRRNGRTVDPAPWLSAEMRKAKGT